MSIVVARGKPDQARSEAAKPTPYPPIARLMIRLLDPLPWPVGEDLMAVAGMAQALVRPRQLHRALAWARGQSPRLRRPWLLALALLANYGRAVAQESLVGIRDPDLLRRRFLILGEEHLRTARARGGTILLGFHAGPAGSAVALGLAGYRMVSVEGVGDGPPRAGAAWSGVLRETLAVAGRDPRLRAAALNAARRYLLGGATLYLNADGPFGTEAFRIPLTGGSVVIRSGWLTLRRHTGAATLPVLSHADGRRWVITIHPPLPAWDRDSDGCRAVLTRLLEDYARRFPEQCRTVVWS